MKIPAIFLAGFSLLIIIGYIAFQTLLPALGIINNNSFDIPVIEEPAYNAGTSETTSIENPSMATNIVELGGLGDGVFDNTAVIQAAEDNGVDIYFPDGVYRINGYILKKNSSWYGQSKFGTILLYDDAFNYQVPSILEDPEESENGGSPFLRTEFSKNQFIETDDYNSFAMQDFTLTGGIFAYSVIAVNESEDNTMPPINYVNVSNNVINATTNFNVPGYESWASALALNGTGTVYSIAENNTIAGNFESVIDGFKIVKNNQLDLTDCRQAIRGAQIAVGNVVNISGIGVTGID